MTVIRPWIGKKIIELLGFEDEVVAEYAMGLLEDESQPVSLISFSRQGVIPLFFALLNHVSAHAIFFPTKGTRP